MPVRHDVAIMPQIPSGFGQNRGILPSCCAVTRERDPLEMSKLQSLASEAAPRRGPNQAGMHGSVN